MWPDNLEKGLVLENQLSQRLALHYLDRIDMLVKEKLGIKGHVKYMDDFILIHCDKWYLQYCLEEINKVCNEKLNLELNQKTQIGIAYNGIDFLGFNHILTGSGKVLWNLDFLLNKEWEKIRKQ